MRQISVVDYLLIIMIGLWVGVGFGDILFESQSMTKIDKKQVWVADATDSPKEYKHIQNVLNDNQDVFISPPHYLTRSRIFLGSWVLSLLVCIVYLCYHANVCYYIKQKHNNAE